MGFTASLTATTKESGQTTETNTTTQRGGQIVAGNNVAISAQNDANIKGIDIVAQTGDLTLTGKTVNIESTENTAKTKTNSHETSLTTTLAHSTGILNAPTLSGKNGHSTRADVTNRHATLTADNGTLKINSTNDTTVKGAVAQAKDVDIQTGGNLTVQSVQDAADGDNRSRDISIGDTTGYGANDGNIKKRWTNVIAKIIGTDSVKVKTAKTLTLDGATIANQKADGSDSGNLEVTADTLVAKTMTDTHTESSTGHGFTRHGADPDKGILPTDGNSSRIIANTGGIEREVKTKPTIGAGTIDTNKTTGEVNQNIAQVQETTKDKKTGGLNIDTTLEDAAAENPGEYLGETLQGVGGMTKTVQKAANRITDAASDIKDAVIAGVTKGVYPIKDYESATNFRQATLDFQEQNPKLTKVLNNKESATPEEYNKALTQYATYVDKQMGGKGQVKIELIDSNQMTESEKVAKNGVPRAGKGLHNKDNLGESYINIGKTDMTNPDDLVTVAGHESMHATGEHSEKVADRAGTQAKNAWGRENAYNGTEPGGGYARNGVFYRENKDDPVIAKATQTAINIKDPEAYNPYVEFENAVRTGWNMQYRTIPEKSFDKAVENTKDTGIAVGKVAALELTPVGDVSRIAIGRDPYTWEKLSPTERAVEAGTTALLLGTGKILRAGNKALNLRLTTKEINNINNAANIGNQGINVYKGLDKEF